MEDFSESAEEGVIPGSGDFHSQKQFQQLPPINYAPLSLDFVSSFGDLAPSVSVSPPISQVDVMREESLCTMAPIMSTNHELVVGDKAARSFRESSPFGCNNNVQQSTGTSTAGAFQAPIAWNSICFENTNNNNGIGLGYASNQTSINAMYQQPSRTTQYSGGNIDGTHIHCASQPSQQLQMRAQVYTGKQSPDRRRKATKKRKKKGVDEPQRPVSAYALFFRDTQAAIKNENSSATFGEISKIVASMWDNLSEQAKQVYKQKTENAKREYLKHLAAFRANMISKEVSSASRLVGAATSQAEIYVMGNKDAQPPQPARTIVSTSMPGLYGASPLNVSVPNAVAGITSPLFISAQSRCPSMPIASNVSTSCPTQLQDVTSEGHYLPLSCRREMPPVLTLSELTDKGPQDLYQQMVGLQNNSQQASGLMQNLESPTDPSCQMNSVPSGQESFPRSCMRPGCNNLVMPAAYSNDNYCSADCAYGHLHCH